MKAPETFRLGVDELGVATITFDAPETLNALTLATYRELGSILRQLGDEPEVKAVVLTGAGRGFCSGGNVRELVAALTRQTAPEHLAFSRLTAEAVLAMRRLRKPVIAAVNGVAAGGGAALALAADVRLASTEARLGFVFPRVGLSGADMGVTWLLPRVVGLGRATELLLTGELVDAGEAAAMGLVNRVVSPERLLDEAQGLAARLARGPTFAHATTKETLDRVAGVDLETALAFEAQAQALCFATEDFREAYEALVGNRQPRFTGR